MNVLDDLFAPRDRKPPATIWGKVTNTNPFSVQINGTAPASAVEGFLTLKTYQPAIDDTVVLLRVGPTYVVIGALDV